MSVPWSGSLERLRILTGEGSVEGNEPQAPGDEGGAHQESDGNGDHKDVATGHVCSFSLFGWRRTGSMLGNDRKMISPKQSADIDRQPLTHQPSSLQPW